MFHRIIRRLKRRNPVRFWREAGATIGENCEIYPSVSLGSEPYLIKMGNHVRITAGVKFVTHDGGVWVLRELKKELKEVDLFGKIVIGDNVHIGLDSVIMPGVTIGNNVIIGCGAIVTKDIPDNSIAVGVPARVISSIDEYERKNADKFVPTKSMTREYKRKYLQENFIGK